jgi:hypothetical protein
MIGFRSPVRSNLRIKKSLMMDFVDGQKMSCMILAPKMTIRKKDSGENGADTIVSTLCLNCTHFFFIFTHLSSYHLFEST